MKGFKGSWKLKCLTDVEIKGVRMKSEIRDFGEGESEDSIKGKTQLERRQLRGPTQ